MATQSKLTISAIIIVVLSLLIISFPSANGAETTSSYSIQDMRVSLRWGDVADSLPASTNATVWDGVLTLSGGRIKVLNQLIFQDANDRVLNKDGEQISFQSDIRSDYDGLQIRLVPDRTDPNPILYFDSKQTGRIAFPLKTLARDKVAQTTLINSGAVLAEATEVFYNKGSLQKQLELLLSRKLGQCTSSGSTQSGCLLQVEKETAQINYAARLQKLSALSTERTAVDLGMIPKHAHPDYLNIVGAHTLQNMERVHFALYDFKLLSFLSRALYERLLEVAPDILYNLPSEHQERIYILEGALPPALARSIQLGDGTYSTFKQIINTFPEIKREQLFKRFGLLTPARWEKIKSLSTEELTLVLSKLSVLPTEDTDTLLGSYMDQLEKLKVLEANFSQVETFLSTAQSNSVKELLSNLKKSMIDDSTLTPSIYRQLEIFFSKMSILTKKEQESEIRSLIAKGNQVLAESMKSKVQKGVVTFYDTDESAWYYAYVAEASRKNIINGYKDKNGVSLSLYGPADNVTVAELLKMALETSGAETSEKDPVHTEGRSHWAKAYITRAEELNMSLLAPKIVDFNKPATRSEVIKTLIEAFGYFPKEPTEYDFSDVTKETPGARYIYFAKELGIISGDDNSTQFRPYDPINRAEVAKIITNLILSMRDPIDKSMIGGELTL